LFGRSNYDGRFEEAIACQAAYRVGKPLGFGHYCSAKQANLPAKADISGRERPVRFMQKAEVASQTHALAWDEPGNKLPHGLEH
jgi:hypothetical protein